MTIGPVKSDQSSRIAVLGAPIDLGASQRGTLMGPAALRTAGLLILLEGLGFDVTDHGDLCIAGMADVTIFRTITATRSADRHANTRHNFWKRKSTVCCNRVGGCVISVTP